jgi:murein DD-endopeptidase MepM/ murein hydrolase activator NlpD
VDALPSRLAILVLLAPLVGCGGLTPAATPGIDHTSDGDGVAGGTGDRDPRGLLASNAQPEAYRLPWSCGRVWPVNQGNHGDICGVVGDHLGIQEYAWDFGLPMRTPVLAARAGVVTLASNPSPPGALCHNGCPFDFGSKAQIACCAVCQSVANRINVRHEDGAISSYAHFEELVVRLGQEVRAGQLLGFSGTSGCSTGPHLHFQVMAGCDGGYCQSLPLTFDEAGIPVCGEEVSSQNACD